MSHRAINPGNSNAPTPALTPTARDQRRRHSSYATRPITRPIPASFSHTKAARSTTTTTARGSPGWRSHRSMANSANTSTTRNGASAITIVEYVAITVFMAKSPSTATRYHGLTPRRAIHAHSKG